MKTQPLPLPISIVIPTYFEEKLLPRLLESIKKQIAQPLEIIVADAFSTDKTREIAVQYGARVVDGGKVAVGRNNGAKIAKGEYVLFLDADSYIPDIWMLLDAYVQMVKHNADIASTYYRPDVALGFSAKQVIPHIAFGMVNMTKHVQKLFRDTVFTEFGIFILVKREVFEQVGGFDPKYEIGEDREFFHAALKKKFHYILLNMTIKTSARRYDGVKSLLKMGVGLLAAGVVVFLGQKNNFALRKKVWKIYGELGGKYK